MIIVKALAVLAGLLFVVSIFGVWAVSPHSPDLSVEMATALISASPEFSRHATLELVTRTERGHDSLSTCCYSADLRLRENGSNEIISAQASFYFDSDKEKWHLGRVWWGEPPNARSIDIRQ